MGKMQRRKGKTGELEICTLLTKAGIPAKRISMLETNHTDKGDIRVWNDIASVKRGQHVPKFVYTALGDTTYLFMRRDNNKWLVTMNLETFLAVTAIGK